MTCRVFETPRLRGLRLQREHLAAMLAVYGDAEVVRWAGDRRPLDRSQCECWLKVTQDNYARRAYGMFALQLRSTGALIGFCGLIHPGQQEQAEIKYALRRDCWGMGYATEAARALLQAAHRQFGLREVIATTAPQNHASHHVLLKAGMRRGELRANEDGSSTQLFSWQAPD
jgi:RimJ/RimL family protein N-acetyltransferase